MSFTPTPTPLTKMAKPKRGRASFLKNPTTTTLSFEEDLLNKARRVAFGANKSLSRWVSEAMCEKLKRAGRAGR